MPRPGCRRQESLQHTGPAVLPPPGGCTEVVATAASSEHGRMLRNHRLPYDRSMVPELPLPLSRDRCCHWLRWPHGHGAGTMATVASSGLGQPLFERLHRDHHAEPRWLPERRSRCHTAGAKETAVSSGHTQLNRCQKVARDHAATETLAACGGGQPLSCQRLVCDRPAVQGQHLPQRSPGPEELQSRR